LRSSESEAICGFQTRATVENSKGDAMIDMMQGLEALEDALRNNLIPTSKVESGRIHPDLTVVFDNPQGHLRISYAFVADRRVRAYAIFMITEPIDGVPCFQLGYAVRPEFRGQGLGSDIVRKGIDEIYGGLKGSMPVFYIEAVVDRENFVSQRIAERFVSDEALKITDSYSGEPAFGYLRRMEA